MPGKPPGMPPPPAAEALDLISFSRCLRSLACLLFSLSSALVWGLRVLGSRVSLLFKLGLPPLLPLLGPGLGFRVWIRRPDVLGFCAKNALSPLPRPPFSRVLQPCHISVHHDVSDINIFTASRSVYATSRCIFTASCCGVQCSTGLFTSSCCERRSCGSRPS